MKTKRPKPEKPDELQFVGFKADAETVAAIKRLEAVQKSEGSVDRGRKSAAIRKAIKDAAARLPGGRS